MAYREMTAMYLPPMVKIKLLELAEKEKRSVSSMAALLVEWALIQGEKIRKAKKDREKLL